MEMGLFEAIKKRHSYRENFKDQPIPRAHLEKIVEAGIMAPSGCNLQTTDFIIVDEPELIANMAAIIGYRFLPTTRAMIVCVILKHKLFDSKVTYEVEDAAAAAENMLLAATALGYAGLWIDGNLRREDKAKRIGKLINVPQGKQVKIVLPLGIPAEIKEQKTKKAFSERAWYNRYPDRVNENTH